MPFPRLSVVLPRTLLLMATVELPPTEPVTVRLPRIALLTVTVPAAWLLKLLTVTLPANTLASFAEPSTTVEKPLTLTLPEKTHAGGVPELLTNAVAGELLRELRVTLPR